MRVQSIVWLAFGVIAFTGCENGVKVKGGKTISQSSTDSPSTVITPTPIPTITVTPTPSPTPSETPPPAEPAQGDLAAAKCDSWPRSSFVTDRSFENMSCAATRTPYCIPLTAPVEGTGKAQIARRYTNESGTRMMILFDESERIRSIQLELCSSYVPSGSKNFEVLSGSLLSDEINEPIQIRYLRNDGKWVTQSLRLQGSTSNGLDDY